MSVDLVIIGLLFFVTVVLLGMSGIAILNFLTFPRLRVIEPPSTRVSVLIPMRNEAEVIAETLQHLLVQRFQNFEILLLDDHSTDDSSSVARVASGGDPRVRVLQGQALPAGWLGKTWACQQLANSASGDILIFTDADVQWTPLALPAIVAEFERSGADLLAVWPTQITKTWGERLVVPLMSLVVMAYLPVLLVHHMPWASFAAANGQCLVFRRRAYEQAGGHASVRGEVLEDVAFARHAKRQGLRLRMVDASDLIFTRMYQNWPAVRDGYAKNILAGYGNSVFMLGLATLFHWAIFVFPWLLFFVSLFAEHASFGWQWPLLLGVVGIALRASSAAFTKQRVADAVFLPISVVLMTRIAVRSVWWRWRYGGPRWKGRLIRT